MNHNTRKSPQQKHGTETTLGGASQPGLGGDAATCASSDIQGSATFAPNGGFTDDSSTSGEAAMAAELHGAASTLGDGALSYTTADEESQLSTIGTSDGALSYTTADEESQLSTIGTSDGVLSYTTADEESQPDAVRQRLASAISERGGQPALEDITRANASAEERRQQSALKESESSETQAKSVLEAMAEDTTRANASAAERRQQSAVEESDSSETQVKSVLEAMAEDTTRANASAAERRQQSAVEESESSETQVKSVLEEIAEASEKANAAAEERRRQSALEASAASAAGPDSLFEASGASAAGPESLLEASADNTGELGAVAGFYKLDDKYEVELSPTAKRMGFVDHLKWFLMGATVSKPQRSPHSILDKVDSWPHWQYKFAFNNTDGLARTPNGLFVDYMVLLGMSSMLGIPQTPKNTAKQLKERVGKSGVLMVGLSAFIMLLLSIIYIACSASARILSIMTVILMYPFRAVAERQKVLLKDLKAFTFVDYCNSFVFILANSCLLTLLAWLPLALTLPEAQVLFVMACFTAAFVLPLTIASVAISFNAMHTANRTVRKAHEVAHDIYRDQSSIAMAAFHNDYEPPTHGTLTNRDEDTHQLAWTRSPESMAYTIHYVRKHTGLMGGKERGLFMSGAFYSATCFSILAELSVVVINVIASAINFGLGQKLLPTLQQKRWAAQLHKLEGSNGRDNPPNDLGSPQSIAPIAQEACSARGD